MFLLLEKISKNDFKNYLRELYNFSLTVLEKIDRPPKVILRYDQENADDLLGKTGYYDPEAEEIHLFLTDRHPKDVLRSFAHELVHHEQNCRGENKNLNMSLTKKDPSYSLHDQGLRNMEKEAFERGNMIFRDWCDIKKIKQKGEIMSENKKIINDSKQETESSHPYPELFKEKERLMKSRMNQHEDLIFQELLKKFINKG